MVVFMLFVIKKSKISGVSKLGKSSVVFIEKGSKINQKYYCSDVLASLTVYVDNDYVLCKMVQGTAKWIVEYLNINVPNSWPPNNPDLNLMDYYVWSRLENMVYEIKITVIRLKQHIIDCWKEIPLEEINKAIDALRRRLRKVKKVNG